jgi:hypothetical protein
MAASKYKLWAIGQPVGAGVSGSIHVGMAAVAKKASAGEPNIVINELLCSLLARSLFLPCPPGALLENSGENYYCSLNFNLAGQSLPPTSVPLLVTRCPEMCWGILLFDVLVMNPDRHNQNLSFDRTTNAVQIFDHSRAFLPLKATVEERIKENEGQLGFAGHCLSPEISSMAGFDYWVARIKSLPDYCIEETIEEISHIGFPADKKSLTVNFIKSRRNSIDTIIHSNMVQFPKLPKPVAPVAVVAAPPAGAAGPVPSSKPAPQPGQQK